MNDLHASPPDDETRRQALAGFLRSRREKLQPSDVGLPAGFRRRTPGLRREEVAQLAGMGITWYTWLEQGRDVQPSTERLLALAKALRLNATERRHLSDLTGRPFPKTTAQGPEQVDAPLLRMLESLTTQPAYVLGRRWDVLAWNHAARTLFGDYGSLQGDERNILHLVFANDAHRRLLVDWDLLAPAALAMFRADCARHAGHPEFERLVATLQRASPEFRTWWPRHELLPPWAGQKRIRHPMAGLMHFEYTSLAVSDPPDMKLVVYTPSETDDSAGRLSTLLATAPAHGAKSTGRRNTGMSTAD